MPAEKGPVNFDLRLKPSPFVERLQQFAARRNESGAGALGTGPPNGRYAAGGAGNRGLARHPSPQTADQQVDQALQNELNSQQQQNLTTPANGSSNESFLVSGSLSPGMAQGSQADSGPDMRFMGAGGPGGIGEMDGNQSAPGFGASGTSGGSGAEALAVEVVSAAAAVDLVARAVADLGKSPARSSETGVVAISKFMDSFLSPCEIRLLTPSLSR